MPPLHRLGNDGYDPAAAAARRQRRSRWIEAALSEEEQGAIKNLWRNEEVPKSEVEQLSDMAVRRVLGLTQHEDNARLASSSGRGRLRTGRTRRDTEHVKGFYLRKVKGFAKEVIQDRIIQQNGGESVTEDEILDFPPEEST